MTSGVRRFAWLGFVVFVSGCGRLTSSEGGGSPEDAGDAGAVETAQDAAAGATVTGTDAGTTHLSEDAGPPLVIDDDAGACTLVADAASLAGRVPVSHRPSGSTCPARAPGNDYSSCSPDAGALTCLQDSDCTAGKVGRCLIAQIPPPPPYCSSSYCSYDQCESDTDCPSGVPCECRASASDSSPNVCATGSNCQTDSDCGDGGYCSPSQNGCGQPSYFCHTPADRCIDATDCCWPTLACSYDVAKGHFACAEGCVPPP